MTFQSDHYSSHFRRTAPKKPVSPRRHSLILLSLVTMTILTCVTTRIINNSGVARSENSPTTNPFYEPRRYEFLATAEATTGNPAIPGEVALSGACGGIQLLGLEDRRIRQKWRSSSGVWSNRVGKGYRIFASHAAPNTFFQHFGAYIERNVAAGHEKTARCCAENGLKELSPDGVMRRRELASPWPSRRGWLPEVAAWIRRGNDGSGNVGGPTTIVG